MKAALFTPIFIAVAYAIGGRDYYPTVTYERFPNYIIVRTSASVGGTPPITMGGQPLVGFSGVWYFVAPGAEGGPIRLIPEESLHEHYNINKKVDAYRRRNVFKGIKRPGFLLGLPDAQLAERTKWWYGKQEEGKEGMCGIYHQKPRRYWRGKFIDLEPEEDSTRLALYSVRNTRVGDDKPRPKLVFGMQPSSSNDSGSGNQYTSKQVLYYLGCTPKELASRFSNAKAKGNWEHGAGDKKQSAMWRSSEDHRPLEFFACLHPVERVFYLATSSSAEDKPYSTFHLCVRLAELAFARILAKTRVYREEPSESERVLQALGRMDSPTSADRYAEVLQLDKAVAQDPSIQDLFSHWDSYEQEHGQQVSARAIKQLWKEALRGVLPQNMAIKADGLENPEQQSLKLDDDDDTTNPHDIKQSPYVKSEQSVKIEEDAVDDIDHDKGKYFQKRERDADADYDIYEDEPEVMKYAQVEHVQRGTGVPQTQSDDFPRENQYAQQPSSHSWNPPPYRIPPWIPEVKSEEYVKIEETPKLEASIPVKEETPSSSTSEGFFNFDINPNPQPLANHYYPPTVNTAEPNLRNVFVGQVSYPFLEEQQKRQQQRQQQRNSNQQQPQPQPPREERLLQVRSRGPRPVDIFALTHEILDDADLSAPSADALETLRSVLTALRNSQELVEYHIARLNAQKKGKGGQK